MAERFGFLGATHDRPRRRLLFGFAAFVASVFVCFAAAALVGPIGFFAMTFAALFGATRAVHALASARSVVNSEAVLEEGNLRIASLDLDIPRDGVRQGLESGSDGGVILDLSHGETLRLRFGPDQESADRLLTALGIGAKQRTTTIPLRRQLGRFTIGLVTFFLGLWPSSLLGLAIARLISLGGGVPGGGVPGFVAFPLIFGLAAILTASVVHRFGSPEVVIGTDGIRIRGMLRQPFIRYSDITRVRRAGWSIVLDLENGERRELPVVAVDEGRVSGLVRRIERARRRAGEGRSFVADSLSRAGRSMADWKASLRSLAQREASFREAPVDRDEVERIASDPDANAEQRIGAAYVLTRIDKEAGHRHVRIAADATADNELKSALLAAAEGEMDSDAIERLAKKAGRVA